MKRIGLLGVYEWGLLAVVFLVVLHAPFSVGIGNVLPDYALALKAWKEITLALLGVMAVVLITRRRLWTKLLSDWLVRLALAFIVLHLILAVVLGGDSPSVVAGLMIDLRFIVMFLHVYVLAILRPGALHRVLLSVAAGAVVVLGFGLLQITVLPDDTLRGIGYSRETITPYTTIDNNQDYVRINSTLRGPNPLGALAVVYATLAVAYVSTRYATASARLRAAMIASIVVAVAVLFASYSRSAYVALVVSMALLAATVVRPTKKIIAGVGVGLVLVGMILAVVSATDWYANVILHEDPESTSVSKSNDDHLLSLNTGLERTLTQPIGAGVGSTGSASLYDKNSANDTIIENYYFFVAHESGWLGLGLFVSLFGLILVRLWRSKMNWIGAGVLASGLGLAVIGLLLPVWADETVALTWWALAGAVIAPTSGIIKGRHGKRPRD